MEDSPGHRHNHPHSRQTQPQSHQPHAIEELEQAEQEQQQQPKEQKPQQPVAVDEHGRLVGAKEDFHQDESVQVPTAFDWG